MKLHLHLGAHKTATTHFQRVLKENRHLYCERVKYIEMEEFRENLKWSNGKIDYDLCGKYLNQLKETSLETLVISEENLSGETKDIYKQLFLYSDIEKRLGSLSKFTQSFDQIEIWFSVRSMDGFLPSIYCESLRHWPFRKFGEVYSGNYEQIWLPVIKEIRRAFPKVRINIVRYENYMKSLPDVIDRIFSENTQWEYLSKEKHRVGINHYACEFIKVFRFILPRNKTSKLIQYLSDFFDRHGIGYKFSPFNRSQVKKLLEVYERDVKAIGGLQDVHIY